MNDQLPVEDAALAAYRAGRAARLSRSRHGTETEMAAAHAAVQWGRYLRRRERVGRTADKLRALGIEPEELVEMIEAMKGLK